MNQQKIEKMREARKGVKAERNPVKKYFDSEKRTRAGAIKAFCAQCMGCDYDFIEPGFVGEIRNCTSKKCALYDFRPYQ